MIPLPLPNPKPEVTWRLVTPELRATRAYYPELEAAFLEACRKPGWNPRTVQMAGFLRAVDFCASHRDGSFHSYATALIADHPYLAELPRHAPRALRHPYLAATRIKYLRSTEGWDHLGDMRRAEEAAMEFNFALGRAAS